MSIQGAAWLISLSQWIVEELMWFDANYNREAFRFYFWKTSSLFSYMKSCQLEDRKCGSDSQLTKAFPEQSCQIFTRY